jgi:hypothetical protein
MPHIGRLNKKLGSICPQLTKELAFVYKMALQKHREEYELVQEVAAEIIIYSKKRSVSTLDQPSNEIRDGGGSTKEDLETYWRFIGGRRCELIKR